MHTSTNEMTAKANDAGSIPSIILVMRRSATQYVSCLGGRTQSKT